VSAPQPLRIVVARPRGFCAGVERAIQVVELALARFGPPVYVRHAIVHNRGVLDRLRAKGAVFVDEPGDAPPGAVLVYSAHGVSPAVREAAALRGQHAIDGTCPLVAKVHEEARRFSDGGFQVLLVGHSGHVEVEGTRGEIRGDAVVIESALDAEQVAVRDPERLAVLTQTTLSVDEVSETLSVLRRRFPQLRAPRKQDICFATQNRQDAVKKLAARVERILVIGSPESSNGMRLLETARRAGVPALRIENDREIDWRWLDRASSVGITAGAAVPEAMVLSVVEAICRRHGGAAEVEELDGPDERVAFALPREIRWE
jgi:4-hydroxy-3-methylbut-2-enyl diphosphate reductase